MRCRENVARPWATASERGNALGDRAEGLLGEADGLVHRGDAAQGRYVDVAGQDDSHEALNATTMATSHTSPRRPPQMTTARAATRATTASIRQLTTY